jgi:hypothetical protein
MNLDSHLIFEAYRKKLLKEAPIGAEYEPFAAATKQAVTGRAGDTYLFADLIKKTGKTADEVVDMIVKPVYDALFPGGRFDAEGSEKEQLNSLQTAIHSELVHLGYPKARAGYTARIIKNAVTPAVKFLSDKAVEGEDVDHQDVENAIIGSIENNDEQSGNELKAAPAQHGHEPAAETESSSGDRETAALMQSAVEQAGEGVNENELIASLKQRIVQKDSEISDARATGRARGVISKLVAAKVLSKRGNIIELGDKAEEFTDKGDLSLVTAEPEEYAAREFGVGSRPTTGRQVFGGEGGRHGVDFG